jgi:hypothetical protein
MCQWIRGIVSMNKQQSRHVQAMARKINRHAKKMVRSMTILEQAEYLYKVPLSAVIGDFNDLTQSWEAITHVLIDMLPKLDTNLTEETKE